MAYCLGIEYERRSTPRSPLASGRFVTLDLRVAKWAPLLQRAAVSLVGLRRISSPWPTKWHLSHPQMPAQEEQKNGTPTSKQNLSYQEYCQNNGNQIISYKVLRMEGGHGHTAFRQVFRYLFSFPPDQSTPGSSSDGFSFGIVWIIVLTVYFHSTFKQGS